LPDEIVTIRIDFEANRRDMAQVIGELTAFEAAVERANDATGGLNTTTRRFERTARSADEPLAAMKKRFTHLEQSGRRFSRQLSVKDKLMKGFAKSSRFLLIQLIALVAEFVITAATLASVNLAFKLGRYAVKGYNITLGLTGAALATVAVAAGAAAAAFKEFNAAGAAWQYKGATIYGDATNAAGAAMRNLTADTTLATMGVAQLTQAYKAMSQQGRITAAQTKAISGSMDFTARSGDVGKSFQAMANFVAILQKEGKVTGKASTAATGVSKEFAEAIKKSKKKDAKSILASMASGALADQAGVKGEFGSIKGTLVSQFKQITVALSQDLADFGAQFLNDVKRVVDGLFKNVRNVFQRLAPEFSAFGKNKLFPAITTIGNALERFSVTLVRKYLPMLNGASDWFKRTVTSFTRAFNEFKQSLEKFRAGSKIITDTFKGPIFAIFKVFGRNAESLGYLAEDNEEQFNAWGDALERLVFAIGDWFAALKVAFTEALPVLTSVVNILASLIEKISGVVKGIGTLRLGGGEGFLGFGGSGGGPSGTVGGGLGPGVASMVSMGLMFAAFKGRRAYRRGGNIGSLKELADPSSMLAARAYSGRNIGFSERLFGGIPAILSPSRYRGMFSRGGAMGGRMTPGELAAARAVIISRNMRGRTVHGTDEEAMMRQMTGQGAVSGAFGMGIGGDRQVYDSTGQRIGFNSLGEYSQYQLRAGSRLAGSTSSIALQSSISNAERAVMASAAYTRAASNPKKQQQMLAAARENAAAEHMSRMQGGRELAYGNAGLRRFFFGGQMRGMNADGTETALLNRRSAFSMLSGKRLRTDIADMENQIARPGRMTRAAALRAGMSVDEYLLQTNAGIQMTAARQAGLQDFLDQDKAGVGKYVDRVTGEFRSRADNLQNVQARQAATGPFVGSGPGGAPLGTAEEREQRRQLRREQRERIRARIRDFRSTEAKAGRALGRKEFMAATRSQFSGLGEGAQASARKLFNPMLGMAGGMLLSTGITEKIGDKDLRGAANNALGVGAMFGGRGMLVAGGLSLMKSTSTKKAALGGAMAGMAVGKTIVDVAGPLMTGPHGMLAKTLIIGGSALIGGVIGAFKAKSNRMKEARGVGKNIANRMLGRFTMAMAGGMIDPKTGLMVQRSNASGQAISAGQAGIAESKRQQLLISELDFGGLEKARADYAGKTRTNQIERTERFKLALQSRFKQMQDMGLMSVEDKVLADKYMKEEKFDEAYSILKGFKDPTMSVYRGDDGKLYRMNRTRSAKELGIEGGVGKLNVAAEDLNRLGTGDLTTIYAERYSHVSKQLSAILGLTEDEVAQLASKMNVNLGDPMASITDTIVALGKATRKTADQMNQAIRDIQNEAVNLFDEEIRKRAVASALDESYNRLLELGGSASLQDFADFSRKNIAAAQERDPNNTFLGLEQLKYFSEGTFSGIAMTPEQLASFRDTGAEAIARQGYQSALSGTSKLSVQSALGGLSEQGFVMKDLAGANKLQGIFSDVYGSDKFTAGEKQNLLDLINRGEMFKQDGTFDIDRLRKSGAAGAALALKVQQALGTDKTLFDVVANKITTVEGTLEIKGEALTKLNEIADALKDPWDSNTDPGSRDAPQWWSQMKKYQWQVDGNTLKLVDTGGDTRTPRRQMVGDTRTPRRRAIGDTRRPASVNPILPIGQLPGGDFLSGALKKINHHALDMFVPKQLHPNPNDSRTTRFLKQYASSQAMVSIPLDLANMMVDSMKVGKERGVRKGISYGTMQAALYALGMFGPGKGLAKAGAYKLHKLLPAMSAPAGKIALKLLGKFVGKEGKGVLKGAAGPGHGNHPGDALSNTMDVHDRINSMLTGKRQVTSSYRTDMLGSPSSDHAAGRAYDLTGENLGEYMRMVQRIGGFAEYHGFGPSRHLHVVPPSNVPSFISQSRYRGRYGDTRTTRADRPGNNGPTGQMGAPVTVNVYAAPGQSEATIAKKVVEAIEQRERQYRERR